MATKTGNVVNASTSGEGSYQAKITYTTSSNATSYTIESNYYLHAVTNMAPSLISWGFTYTLSGSTSGTFDGKTPTLAAGADQLKFTRSKTITKTTSAQTYKVYFTCDNSLLKNAGSTATLSVTIPALTSYAVKYSANINGTVNNMPSNQTKYYGKNLTLRSSVPTRAHYTFSHWDTKADGTGTNYSPGGTYKANATVTLYARWKNDVYKITLNNQGATTAGTTAFYEKYYDDYYTTSACSTKISKITKPTKVGYIFNGYFTQPNGAGERYIDTNGNIKCSTNVNNKYDFTANTTLYASWTPIVYNINYILNAGNETITNNNRIQYTIEDTPFTLTNLTRTNYSFDGWTGTDISVPTTDVVIHSGSIGNRTYTANWSQKYFPPTVQIITAKRVTEKSNGTYQDDDTGIIPYIKFKWENGLDQTSGTETDVVPTTYAITFISQNSNNNFAVTGSLENADNPIEVICSNVDPRLDQDGWSVSLSLYKDNGHTLLATTTSFISAALFIIDIAPNRNYVDGEIVPVTTEGMKPAISFGSSVSDDDEGFHCHMDAQFYNKIYIHVDNNNTDSLYRAIDNLSWTSEVIE